MSGRLKRCFFLLAGFLLLAASGCFRAAHVEGRFGEAGGNRYEVFLQAPYDFSPEEGYFELGEVVLAPAWYLNQRDLLNTSKLQVSSGGLGRLYMFVGPILAYLNVWQSHWARAESTAGEKYYLEEVAWVVPGIHLQLPIGESLAFVANYDLYSERRPSNYRVMAGLLFISNDDQSMISFQGGRRSWSLDSSDAEIEGSVDEVGFRVVYVPIEPDDNEAFFITLAAGYEWVENQFTVASATPVSLDKEGTFISIGIGFGIPAWGMGLH